MNKVYCLINTDASFNIAASKTRCALEELMCDMFMQDFQNEMQDAVDAHWINIKNPTKEECQYAKDIWDMLLNRYERNYQIERVKIV